MKIFWSWQSDMHQESGRYFVRDVLHELAGELNGFDGTDEAERPHDRGDEDGPIELDHDTLGIAGSPPIAETILGKIQEAAVFVADVTPVGQTPGGKRLANPNVMIELGYALKAIGHQRIVLVMNQAEGADLRTLPFDLRHWRGPVTYKLKRDVGNERKEEVRQALKAALRERLTPCLAHAARVQQESRRLTQPTPKLQLMVKAPEGPIARTISQLVTDLGVDTLEQIKAKTPLRPVPDRDPPGVVRPSPAMRMFYGDLPTHPSQWTRKETEGYNGRVQSYYRQHERYLEELTEFRRLELRTLHVELQVSNSGTKPATNIDVEVGFPHGLLVSSAGSPRLPPALPAPPPLRPLSDSFVTARSVPMDFPRLLDRSSGHWTDVNAEQRSVRFHKAELKHGYSTTSDAFAFAFVTSQDIGTVELPYTLSANETPDPIKGILRLQIDRVDE